MVSLLLATAGLAACGADSGSSADGACPTGSALTYTNFGQSFFETNCLACHSSHGRESPKFDSIEQIRAAASQIDRVAAAGPNGVNTEMPQDATVAESERRKLGEWLACGAPD